jgi:hypothetical protein
LLASILRRTTRSESIAFIRALLQKSESVKLLFSIRILQLTQAVQIDLVSGELQQTDGTSPRSAILPIAVVVQLGDTLPTEGVGTRNNVRRVFIDAECSPASGTLGKE